MIETTHVNKMVVGKTYGQHICICTCQACFVKCYRPRLVYFMVVNNFEVSRQHDTVKAIPWLYIQNFHSLQQNIQIKLLNRQYKAFPVGCAVQYCLPDYIHVNCRILSSPGGWQGLQNKTSARSKQISQG